MQDKRYRTDRRETLLNYRRRIVRYGSLGYVSQAKDGCRRWISMQMRRISSMMGQLRGWLRRMM